MQPKQKKVLQIEIFFIFKSNLSLLQIVILVL